MVESASLLRRYTGNCIEGSNPSLSASFIWFNNVMTMNKNISKNFLTDYSIEVTPNAAIKIDNFANLFFVTSKLITLSSK